jgi:hypothetical protein
MWQNAAEIWLTMGQNDVVCASSRVVDGWTGRAVGWFFGVHVVDRVPEDGRCPRCGMRLSSGPGDYFEIQGNQPPDLPDEDDEVIEPQDYTGDYPLESEGGDEDC